MKLYGKDSKNSNGKPLKLMMVSDHSQAISGVHSISGSGRKLCQALLLSLMVIGGLPLAQAANADETTPSAVVETTVSLNSAGVEELQTLNGVGPQTAAAIIAWREQEGPFKAVDQLMVVKGIGEKTLSKIRDRLSL